MSVFFRTTPSSTIFAIFFRTLLYAIVLWSLTLWMLPSFILRATHALGVTPFRFPNAGTAALGLFVSGATLNLFSAWVMARIGKGTPLPLDCAPELVIAGPYRYIRNPMAVGGLLQGFAIGLRFGSMAIIAYVISGLFLWNYFVRPVEEKDLLERFGRAYADYCKQIRCWLPSKPYAAATQRVAADGSDSRS